MENAEEVMHSLEEFSKLKPKEIPKELEDYLRYVAKTGDPVFKWSLAKSLFREKLLNVITDFYERTLNINEVPPCPNVDPFNYERMKANLLEKLDSFPGAPFTVQRISELLTNPSKEYKRADKFMRAIEKNILVVSIREPGRYVESDDSQQESSFNGIPGHNESGIEPPFASNDLADADSSSQSFEVNQQTQTTSAEVSSENLTSSSFKENGENIGDSASSNELDIIRNEEVSQEIIIEEKDTETVICSTLTSQDNEDISDQSENISEESRLKITELTVLAESSDYSESSEDLIDSNTPDSKDLTEESKEAIVTVEVTADSVTAVDSVQMDEDDAKDSSNVVDSSNGSERLVVTVSSNDSSEESSESSSSQTFEESKPAECDTSNSFDSETSNSCDSEVEIKNQEEEVVHQNPDESVDEGKITEMADSTEINEAVCIESNTTEENPEKTAEPEESAVAESTDMEVGECQISQVDQSDS